MNNMDEGREIKVIAPQEHVLSSEQIDALQELAQTALVIILKDNLKLTPDSTLFVLYDNQCRLSSLLARSYASMDAPERLGHKHIEMMDYDTKTAEEILATFDKLKKDDLVVLIQSQHFELNKYRIQIELFRNKIKVIQHVHLGIIYENQYEHYIRGLNFSSKEHKPLALYLKKLVDECKKATVESFDGSILTFEGGFEPSKLNIGDYTDLQNKGGTYPVGEVFSENKTLEGVNGELEIYAFPNHDRQLEFANPHLKLRFKNSVLDNFDELVNADTTPESFKPVLQRMKAAEGEVLVREFGLGLNPGMDSKRPVQDITAFERQIGLHVSLGKMHNIYNKKAYGIKPKKTWFHVDVFCYVKKIILDELVIYDDFKYLPVPEEVIA